MKQLLYVANMLFIHKEQDDMVAGIDDGRVVGDQHFFVANDRANRGPRWQVDFTDAAANHLARLGVTVGDGFDGLRRTAAQ